MDVFVGGIGPRAVAAAERVDHLLREVRAPHRRAELGSALVTAWIDDRSSELLHHLDDELEVVFDGYLLRHGAPSTGDHLPALARRLLDTGRVLAGDESGLFTIVVHERRTGRLLLAGDPSGLLPLHLSVRGRGDVCFGSHLHLLAAGLDASPDHLGVASVILQKYAVGHRTTYEGVERLAAGEVVEVRPDGAVRRTYPEVYFAELREPEGDVADELWEALLAAVEPHRDAGGTIGTMLSEGFDSRLVGGALRSAGIDQTAFTHGTPGTRGLDITRKVARALDAPHEVDLLPSGYPADPEALRRQLLLADNLHIPYWIDGAEHFRATGARAATTGYALDVTIGAHAFSRNEGSGRRRALQRYQEIVRQDLRRISDAEIEAVADDVLLRSAEVDEERLAARVRRFLAPDVAESVVARLPELGDEVRAEVERLRASGSAAASLVVQRYFLENRVRRFSFGQELTLRSQVPIIVPAYEPTFLRVASAVPPRLRMQHLTYLRLFRRHLPDLARIPSGAHMLPMQLPRVVLESGRFLGLARDGRIAERYASTRGHLAETPIRGVLFADRSARQGDRLPMEGLGERGATSLNLEWIDRQVGKIRSHEIRVYLPVLYLPLELRQVFEGRC